MESKSHKNLKALSKKIVLEAKKEETSFDFTSQVMQQLNVNSSEILKYKPLIPKAVWGIILVGLAFWLGYLFKNHFVGNSNWGDVLQLNALFSNIELSKSATYTIGLFALMICIQVPLLKHYFNKRLRV